jgi:hypothetical protein
MLIILKFKGSKNTVEAIHKVMTLYLSSATLFDGELCCQKQFLYWHSISKLAASELLRDTTEFLAADLVVAED